ncbi:hypothetical protein pb186bvf_008553 [Paramecium bursaria]
MSTDNIKKSRREYVRVHHSQKQSLVELVFGQGFRIKDAAAIVKIKYATAKTIIFYYREQKIRKPLQIPLSKRRCDFISNSAILNPLKVVTQIAGGTIYQNEYRVQ